MGDPVWMTALFQHTLAQLSSRLRTDPPVEI